MGGAVGAVGWRPARQARPLHDAARLLVLRSAGGRINSVLERPPSRQLLRVVALVLAAAFLTGCARGDLTSAHIEIENEPGPDTRTLDLLLKYDDCSDGKLPTSVEDVLIEKTDDAVILEVFVRLPSRLIWDDDVTCPGIGGEWLPFTLELPEPLGDRSLSWRDSQNRVHDVWVMAP